MAAVSFNHLSFGFQSTTTPIIDDLSGFIPRGSLTALLGPNGAGKSTLLKIICGLLRTSPIAVQVTPGLKVSYLPQRNEFDLTFPLRVEDVVSMGLWSKVGHFSPLSSHLRNRVHEALEQVGLKGYEKFSLYQLSGGQLQRLLFARLLLQEGDILLLDEPFAAVDQATVKDLMEIIKTWHHQGRTLIIVVHNISLVRTYFPETLLLAHHLIAHGKTEDVLTRENLTKAMYDV